MELGWPHDDFENDCANIIHVSVELTCFCGQPVCRWGQCTDCLDREDDEQDST